MDHLEPTRPHVPPGTTFWQWIAYYFLDLVERHNCHNETELAHAANLTRSKVRRLLERLGLKFQPALVPDQPKNDAAPVPTVAAPPATPLPPTPGSHLLTPEVQARLQTFQARPPSAPRPRRKPGPAGKPPGRQ